MHPAVSNGSYDLARIRADFPALAMQVYGKPLVYLDNAASAQKPRQVLDRLQKAYTEEYANVHRGLHFLANEATEAYEGAREDGTRISERRSQGRDYLYPQCHRGKSTLSLTTFGRERIKAGDEIVLSIMEHHSKYRAMAFSPRTPGGGDQMGAD
jgi:cysteine desulfurase/selenocysteine lyase